MQALELLHDRVSFVLSDMSVINRVSFLQGDVIEGGCSQHACQVSHLNASTNNNRPPVLPSHGVVADVYGNLSHPGMFVVCAPLHW